MKGDKKIMRKSIKKAIAIVSAFAVAFAGLSFTPAEKTAADNGTWSINQPTLVTYTVDNQKVYGLENLQFTAYNNSQTDDYAYGGYVDSISDDNLVRNFSADWLWGIGTGGNGLHYDGVVTNKTKTIYFLPGSTHKFIIAAYDKDDLTTPLDTVEIEINFPAGEIETTVEDKIKDDLVSDDNLAIGKHTFASSKAGAEYAEKNVADKNLGSRWAAASYGAGEYVGVNLGAVYSIDRVALMWEPAYATDYDIEVSTDGVNYTSVKNHKPTKNEVVEFEFSGVEAQFVRIYCNANALEYGYSIYELGVFGTYVREGIQEETTTEKPIEDGDDLIPADKKNSGVLNVPAFNSGEAYSYEYKIGDLKISTEKWYVAKYTVTSNIEKNFELRLQDAINGYADYSGLGFPQVTVPAGESRTVTKVFKGQRDTNGGIFDVCMGFVNGVGVGAAQVEVTNASLKVFSTEEKALAEAGSQEEPTEEPTEKPSEEPADRTWVAIDASDNKLFYNSDKPTVLGIVNVQQPGWSEEKGVYMNVPAGISSVSVNGNTDGVCHIDGAGVVVFNSSFTQEFNTVVINYAGGTATVIIKNIEAVTPITTSDEIEVAGYQVNANTSTVSKNSPSFRITSKAPKTIDDVAVESYGTLYGLEADVTNDSDHFVIDGTNVHKMVASAGLFDNLSDTDNKYFTVTFTNNGITAKAMSAKYVIRPYSVLVNGTVVYGKITTVSIYDVADYLYQNRYMPTVEGHQFLYYNVLNVVKLDENKLNIATAVKNVTSAANGNALYKALGVYNRTYVRDENTFVLDDYLDYEMNTALYEDICNNYFYPIKGYLD
jgi:hypothetical protein